jgi:hypothetical protein
MRRASLVAIAAAALLAGCGGFGGGVTGPTIHLANRTIVPAVVSVNGSWVGTYAAGESAEVPIGGHGGPPYRIEAHSPAGTALGDFEITARDVTSLTAGSSMGGASQTACGLIEFTFGPVAHPSETPTPAPVPVPDPVACP